MGNCKVFNEFVKVFVSRLAVRGVQVIYFNSSKTVKWLSLCRQKLDDLYKVTKNRTFLKIRNGFRPSLIGSFDTLYEHLCECFMVDYVDGDIVSFLITRPFAVSYLMEADSELLEISCELVSIYRDVFESKGIIDEVSVL